MDVREKLVELIYDADKACNNKSCVTCKHQDKKFFCKIHFYIDHLIANSVTVQEWISVKDRLPEKEQDVICSRGNHIGALMDVYTYMGDDKWDDTYGNRSYTEDEGITHWQYLPKPPKGE